MSRTLGSIADDVLRRLDSAIVKRRDLRVSGASNDGRVAAKSTSSAVRVSFDDVDASVTEAIAGAKAALLSEKARRAALSYELVRLAGLASPSDVPLRERGRTIEGRATRGRARSVEAAGERGRGFIGRSRSLERARAAVATESTGHRRTVPSASPMSGSSSAAAVAHLPRGLAAGARSSTPESASKQLLSRSAAGASVAGASNARRATPVAAASAAPNAHSPPAPGRVSLWPASSPVGVSQFAYPAVPPPRASGAVREPSLADASSEGSSVSMPPPPPARASSQGDSTPIGVAAVRADIAWCSVLQDAAARELARLQEQLLLAESTLHAQRARAATLMRVVEVMKRAEGSGGASSVRNSVAMGAGAPDGKNDPGGSREAAAAAVVAVGGVLSPASLSLDDRTTDAELRAIVADRTGDALRGYIDRKVNSLAASLPSWVAPGHTVVPREVLPPVPRHAGDAIDVNGELGGREAAGTANGVKDVGEDLPGVPTAAGLTASAAPPRAPPQSRDLVATAVRSAAVHGDEWGGVRLDGANGSVMGSATVVPFSFLSLGAHAVVSVRELPVASGAPGTASRDVIGAARLVVAREANGGTSAPVDRGGAAQPVPCLTCTALPAAVSCDECGSIALCSTCFSRVHTTSANSAHVPRALSAPAAPVAASRPVVAPAAAVRRDQIGQVAAAAPLSARARVPRVTVRGRSRALACSCVQLACFVAAGAPSERDRSAVQCGALPESLRRRCRRGTCSRGCVWCSALWHFESVCAGDARS